jgi:hypothetical protein
MEVCCGAIVGMGESLEQRAELASQLAEVAPHEVPLNFLDPRPGTPFADLSVLSSTDALRAVGAFRLALPSTILRFAGGREVTLGDLGTRDGLLGGVNAVIDDAWPAAGSRPGAAHRAPHADQDAHLGALTRPVGCTARVAGSRSKVAITSVACGVSRTSRRGSARTADDGWW